MSAARYTPIPAKRTKEMILSMQKLLDSSLIGMSAKEFNQLVRGQLFRSVDFFATNWLGKKDALDTDAALIVSFCEMLIKVICKWFSVAAKYFPLVRRTIED